MKLRKVNSSVEISSADMVEELSNNFIFISCTLVFCLLVCLCEGARSPGMGITDSCELLCRCWELNLNPLAKQSVLSITEPSLCPLCFIVCLFFGFDV